jgi:SulP family sulfate permease
LTDAAKVAWADHHHTPKLFTTFAEGYGLGDLRKDALAGLTVAVVALPLSMAIAIGSGVSPAAGLTTSIVGGFLVSALGGSRFQIGGPAGAFIVLVAATGARFGLDGLLLTVFLSGLMLTVGGLLRLGELVRRIPHAVTVGFTAAIGLIILAGQLKGLFGLHLAGAEPGPLIPKLAALAGAWRTLNPAALALGAGVGAATVFMRWWKPVWPGMLMAVAAAAIIALVFKLPVETIHARFGALPNGLPAPHLPDLSMARVVAVLPSALSFTLLGGIESLLSAVVADGMTGRRHRPNAELVAQGIANVGSALFGGICVTGTIARTATNVKAGARSPVAGVLHSAFVLAFMVAAAPLCGYIPISALSGVLVVVAWNMIEKRALGHLLRHWRPTVLLAATFLLTVMHDLTAGIAAGCGAAAVFWLIDRARARRTASVA